MSKLQFSKAMRCIVIIAAALAVWSCSSGPATMSAAEAKIRAALNRYRSDIILDGASQYTVKSGDRLVDIARANYDSGYDYPLIVLASNNTVLDPDKLDVGMVLTLPDKARNMNDARAKASIKSFFGEIADYEDSQGRSATASGIRAEAAKM